MKATTTKTTTERGEARKAVRPMAAKLRSAFEDLNRALVTVLEPQPLLARELLERSPARRGRHGRRARRGQRTQAGAARREHRSAGKPSKVPNLELVS